MGSMVIRNIPDDVLRRLKERAAEAGKSTEQMAREAITREARMSREEHGPQWMQFARVQSRSTWRLR